MFTLWTALLLGLPASWAHRPHEVVTAFTTAPADSTTAPPGRAWAVLNPHDISQLLRSDDGGLHWDFVCGPTMADDVLAMGYQGPTLVVVGLDGTVWTSADEGETWSDVELLDGAGQVQAVAFAPDYALVASDTGLFVGDLSGASVSVPDGLTQHAGFRATGALAVADDDTQRALLATSEGAIYASDDGGESFQEAGWLPHGLRIMSLASGGARDFAGSNGAGVFWSDGGGAWWACGALPTSVQGQYTGHVPALSVEDGWLVAATGHEALFASNDDCATWRLLQSGDYPAYDTIGNASVPGQAFVSLGFDGEVGYVAGFNGISVTEDAGASWWAAKLIPGDYARGVAFSATFPQDPRIWVGGYGGGAWWSWDGGATWQGSAADMRGAYSYDIQPAADAAWSDEVWFSGSMLPYRSQDGGMRWDLLDERLPMERVRTFRNLGERLLALGEDRSGTVAGRVAWTEDGGESWQEWPALYELLQGSLPSDVQAVHLDGQDLLTVAADAPPRVLFSNDEGQSWTLVWQDDAAQDSCAGFAFWPPEAPARTLLGSPSAGLLRSDDGGQSWTALDSAPAGVPRQLVMADDGTLFLLQRSGQIHRSRDGGESWTAVGEPIQAAVHDLVTAPAFAETGQLLAGTQDGVFFATERGEQWRRIRRFERFEAGTYHLRCQAQGRLDSGGCAGTVALADGACATYDRDGDGLGGGYALQAGDEVSFSWSGTGFRVLASRGRRGTLRVTVDQEELGTLDSDGAFELNDLAAGWKDVVLTWEGPGQLHLDAVEAWGEGDILPIPAATADTGPGSDGGCGSNSRAGLLLLPLLFTPWRRRSGKHHVLVRRSAPIHLRGTH